MAVDKESENKSAGTDQQQAPQLSAEEARQGEIIIDTQRKRRKMAIVILISLLAFAGVYFAAAA